VDPALLAVSGAIASVPDMCSDNASGAVDQQERLDAYIAGYVDGEGSFLDPDHPFFEANPLLSTKQQELRTFASIVRAMADGEHLTEDGFRSLRRRALSMNGGGRYRRIHRVEAFRILRDHTPDTAAPETAPWAANNGEDMVRPAWRHAEPGGNDLAAGGDPRR
jgi:hypothetical protein